MCGIVGCTGRDKKLMQNMRSALAHRGPDDQGAYVDDAISLGHTRLSVIDISKKGHQPMRFGNFILVFNGEIYNFIRLRKELEQEGYSFFSDSDTEVLLKAYAAWGKDCLARLEGMFAFCIYDTKKKILFLARDRWGEKPLYYCAKRERFAFASELHAILEDPSVSRQIDKEGLSQYFTFRFTLGSTTLLKEIRTVEPAHYLMYDLRKKKITVKRRYYVLPIGIVKEPYVETKRKIAALLDASVSARMVADVPVGAFLSGGLDSSAVCTLAKKHTSTLDTFSMGFDTTNELPFAKQVAGALHTRHHPFTMTQQDVLAQLPDMIMHMDEPVGDPGYLPIFVLSKEVRAYNKVVVSGDGADEIFCGYDRYKMLHYGRYLSPLIPLSFGSDVLKRLHRMGSRSGYDSFLEIIRLFDADELQKLGVAAYDARHYWPSAAKADPVTKAMYFDMQTVMPNDFFMKTDKMASAWGLEVRVPFMDRRLVEYAFSIPLSYKLSFWREKAVLKDALETLLPSFVLRRRKHGFNVPIDAWFKGELGDRLAVLLEKSRHGLYNKDFVYALLRQIKKKGGRYKENFILAQKLWSILVFEEWCARLERRGKKP